MIGTRQGWTKCWSAVAGCSQSRIKPISTITRSFKGPNVCRKIYESNETGSHEMLDFTSRPSVAARSLFSGCEGPLMLPQTSCVSLDFLCCLRLHVYAGSTRPSSAAAARELPIFKDPSCCLRLLVLLSTSYIALTYLI